MNIQLPEWLQVALLAGGALLAVWLFIVLIVVYQTALDVSDFLGKERERLGYDAPPGPKAIERWDGRDATPR